MKDQREEFVQLARLPEANISELCRRYGISRKTGYKWLGRGDLEDRSRRPHDSPSRTPEQLQQQVLAVRARYPAWGARKIAHVLARDHGVHIAASTANWVLRRHGLISPQASQAATAWQRFEHEAPNALWQMDFKGHFATDTQRCHPLTVLDDHSRFNVVLQALGNEQLEPVRATLQRRGRKLKRSRRSRRLYEWERQALADAYAGGEKIEALSAEFNVHPSTVGRAAAWAGYTLRSEAREVL